MRQLILLNFTLFILLLTGCKTGTSDADSLDNMDFSNLDFSSLCLDMDFTQPVTFDRAEVSLDQLSSDIAEALYDPYWEGNNKEDSEEHLEGYDIRISETTITVSAIIK